jgi:hypothetical protein
LTLQNIQYRTTPDAFSTLDAATLLSHRVLAASEASSVVIDVQFYSVGEIEANAAEGFEDSNVTADRSPEIHRRDLSVYVW